MGQVDPIRPDRDDDDEAVSRVFARRRFRRDFDACGTTEEAARPSAAATVVRASDRCSADAEGSSGSESLFRQFTGRFASTVYYECTRSFVRGVFESSSR